MCMCFSNVYVLLCVVRVQVRDREIKVNIFDMAGHPFFYEVSHKTSLFYLLFHYLNQLQD